MAAVAVVDHMLLDGAAEQRRHSTDGCNGSVVATSTLDVTMADFGYGGIPDVIRAGTRITVHNDSESELHELVAIGDGVLHEAGRYLLICTIPTGVGPIPLRWE